MGVCAEEAGHTIQLNLPEAVNPEIWDNSSSALITEPGANISDGSKNGQIWYRPHNPEKVDTITFNLDNPSHQCGRIKYSSYRWEFGDGTNSTVRNFDDMVSHQYKSGGNYHIKVYYKNLDCPDKEFLYDEMDLIVYDSTLITVPKKPMVGGRITFSVGGYYPAGTQFFWNFGDGQTTTTSVPTVQHQYLSTGYFSTRVYVNNKVVAQKDLDLTLQKGDILVHAASGLLSHLTPGAWTHAAMYIGNDEVIEAIKPGVRKHRLKDYWFYPEDTCVAVFRVSGLTEAQRNNIVSWALSKDERFYDFPSLPLGLKQADCDDVFLPPNCRWYYCSELVWAAYYRNGINLDPNYGIVFPRTLVTGKQKKTVLVGAHIESIPSSAKDYQKYFDQVIQGENPPYSVPSIGEETGYTLLSLGVNPAVNGTGIVQMVITDPRGRTLSASTTTIPNSSMETIVFDEDERPNDEIGAIRDPIAGAYMIQMELVNQSAVESGITLEMGAWDSDQYSWITPFNSTSLREGSSTIPFMINESELARVITIPSSGQAPLNVSFIDISPLESMNNSWDFGDGTRVSDAKTVCHEFITPGMYTTTMRVWNNTSSSQVSIPIMVQAPPVPLQAKFTADAITGIPPLTVNFTDLSTGGPVSWNWAFGDGLTSQEQNPVHTYTGIGRFTVTLEVKSASAQSIIRVPQYITTNSGKVSGPSGMIWVTSFPADAQVYVDDVLIGSTPLQSMGIPAGFHQLRITKYGYEDWIGYAQVSQGVYTYVPKVILRNNTP
ncbi:MAG TPA: PKD domain-containing protein [Methanospirillum sp.]|nr:PKD domain-containing protein [Methanospirillum sp.]